MPGAELPDNEPFGRRLDESRERSRRMAGGRRSDDERQCRQAPAASRNGSAGSRAAGASRVPSSARTCADAKHANAAVTRRSGGPEHLADASLTLSCLTGTTEDVEDRPIQVPVDVFERVAVEHREDE